jgi:hypothetical protein
MNTAEMDAIAAESAALDAELAPAPIQPGQTGDIAPVVIDTLGEARDLIRFVVGVFVPLYPKLEAVYTAERQDALAQASVPLMEKYGVTMGGMFERWGPEIRFALVAVPLAMETAKVVQEPDPPKVQQNETAP